MINNELKKVLNDIENKFPERFLKICSGGEAAMLRRINDEILMNGLEKTIIHYKNLLKENK